MEFETFNENVPTGGRGRTGASGLKIAAAINAMGFQAVSTERHFDTNYRVWQVKPDVTVAPTKGGLEVVSRTLPGTQASLDEVTKVCNWLESNGYDVDVSCGYHVHIDAGDLTSYECAAIALRYHHCQVDINGILPPSRRGGQWAQNLTGSSLNKILTTITSGERSQRWDSRERYVSVNLQHVANGRSSRRIEFRQHSGTVNASKVIGWYKFLCDFVAETLRLLAEIGGGAVTTPTNAPTIIRQQTRRRSGARTVSIVTGTTMSPQVPLIDPNTDYDCFLRTIEQNGVITTDDARTFGWMDGGTNSTNSRLRVTAHWLRRHGAELLTTQRNGELAYVGVNGARTRAQIFTAPAQIRQRVTVSGAPNAAAAVPTTTRQRDLLHKLSTTDVMSGLSTETARWFSDRMIEIAAADARRAARRTI
jgi:hypothetical protein